MLPRNHPDRIRVSFDDHRLVANAGLLLPATLAHHLGLRELVDHHLDLGVAPGRANTGDKILTLVASALAGGDCIDDADALRAGGTARILGGTIKAPSTLGTFLRSFRWGQHKSLRNLIEAIPEADWTPIPYWMDGAADLAETTYTPFQSEPDAAPVRLIVRRVKPTPGSQLALFATYSYHGFITDRDGETLELEADHRRHAEVENAIRDLKYGVGLNHMPSGRFAANAAWLAIQVMAHNLARWTARTGLGEVVTTKTLRRRFFSLAGRITRSARRLTLHLPQRWPWETQFSRALARLRAIPLPA